MNRNEEIEQARLVRWSHLPAVRARIPALAWLHHSPNGGKRAAMTGAQMKALGTKRGFPDLICPVPSPRGFVGLALELKSERGRPSPEQSAWLSALVGAGWWANRVLRSAEEARTVICEYFEVDGGELPPLPEK